MYLSHFGGSGGEISRNSVTLTVFAIVSAFSNQELLKVGRKQMDETDKSIERSKRVCTKETSLSMVTEWILYNLRETD